jgi:hypothetical protein
VQRVGQVGNEGHDAQRAAALHAQHLAGEGMEVHLVGAVARERVAGLAVYVDRLAGLLGHPHAVHVEAGKRVARSLDVGARRQQVRLRPAPFQRRVRHAGEQRLGEGSVVAGGDEADLDEIKQPRQRDDEREEQPPDARPFVQVRPQEAPPLARAQRDELLQPPYCRRAGPSPPSAGAGAP